MKRSILVEVGRALERHLESGMRYATLMNLEIIAIIVHLQTMNISLIAPATPSKARAMIFLRP
jgi:hypothetical protein